MWDPASQLSGRGPLYLQINQKADYDYDDDDQILAPFSKMVALNP